MTRTEAPDQAVKRLHKELESYLDDCIKARAPFDYEVVEGYISLICDAACLAARAKQGK